ncbi:MAG TPA: (2Fe-2S)-binding protein, partial [Candidatus Latescibacteria bacterium]|nr:(2Fe-2S)-binding protein [Candidatus Latescibacterota bacterium]
MSPLHYGDETLDLVSGKSLFDYADSLDVRVPTSCGRSGECHECIVEVKQGLEALTPPEASEEFLRDNYRLACRARVQDTSANIEFAVLRRQPRILTESVGRDVELEPLANRRGEDVYVGDER